MRKLLGRLGDLLEDGPPEEPVYDPVHLAGVLIAAMAAIGAIYWLLWTLLVFEGGLGSKLGAGLQILFTSKTAADFGYLGAHDLGVFEGWLGNTAALLLSVAAGILLRSLYGEARRRSR